MRAIKLALLELPRFREGTPRRLILAGLALVPLLAGAPFLWANWDPYGRTGQVPVAVVNQDRPARAGGRVVNAGQQFVKQLKTSDLFRWHFVSARQARHGLREGDYYFTITVPENFSTKLASAARAQPQRASLRITGNDANGYLAGLMLETHETELRDQVNAAAYATYARTIYGEIDTIREKLRRASDTAHRLTSGTDTSRKDAQSLADGLSGMLESSRSVSEAARSIAESAKSLDGQLSGDAAGSSGLPGAVNELTNTSGRVVQSLSGVATASGFIAEDAAANVAGIRQLSDEFPRLSSSAGYQRVLADARRLAAATASASSDARSALTTARAANNRAMELQSRMSSISTTLSTLSGRTSQLANGADSLTSGLDALSGSAQSLADSITGHHEDARALSGFVDDSLSRLPPTSPDQVARAAHVLGSPTEIVRHNLNPAGVYGRGMAPLLFAIALWVFGLTAYTLLKPVNLRALGGRTGALTIAVAGWLPATTLGVLASLLLLTVVDVALGLDPVRLWQTVGLLALATAAFVAVGHFLRTLLGRAGDIVSTVLLVVQAVACGGLYPVETTPPTLQALHPVLPMTYLVDGLRVTLTGGLTSHLLWALAVLGGYLVVFLVLTGLVVRRHRTWTVARLHPQLGP